MQEPVKRVLIVDDDADIRAALRAVIESAGYTVEEAANGEDGLLAAQRCCPDVILADLMMEEVNSGAELALSLRDQGCGCPVLLLSSAGEPVSRNINPSDFGLQGVLQKPVPPAALLEALRRVMD
ncbi:MAG: response regulator [Candidatus Hydrogenedentes bacterium]|nr:response regulator [Candidatus Hydrogenedentota bacterium]